MVKRRDKTGRRQILQLEDKKPPQPVVLNKQPIRGIIHYSDSDDEAKKSPVSSEPSVTSASEKSMKDPSIQIDTQVADFLKEIDALTVEEKAEEKESSEAEPKQNMLPSPNENSVLSPSNKENSEDIIAAVENGDTIVESNDVETGAAQGAYSIWQECHDESTGYSYYWNIQTNEVTWECPPEYAAYLQFLHSAESAGISSHTNSSVSEISTSKKRKAKKRETSELEEGKIIPISYFGGSSSSSEDSSDESSASKTVAQSTTKKKNNHNIFPSNKMKYTEKDYPKSSLSKEIVEEIGPQLPPDFQFPDDIPVTPTPSSSSLDGIPYYDKDDEEELIEIGPQLPSYYLPKDARITGDSPVTEEQEVYKLEDNELVSESLCIAEGETNEDSSQDPSQSTINDTKFTVLEHEDDSWEESLSKLNKEFEDQHRKRELNGDEEPDSTTKRDLGLAKSIDVDSSQPNDIPLVFKAVVEYDSDTEEEEEENNRLYSLNNSPNHVKTEIKSDFIDNMFLAHGTGKKFGFGFSKSRQLELENGSFDGGGGKYYGVKRKALNKDSDYPMINFVKSKEILNLNVLNKCDESEDISIESKSDLISEKEIQSSVCVDPDLDEIDKALDKALEKKEETEISELPNSVLVNSPLLPENIAEIPPSEVEVEPSTSSKSVTKSKKHSVLSDNEKPSGSHKKLKKEEPEQTSLTGADMLSNILELSSLLVDKLTFLLASHSTMSSLTSLLIQIQTRLIDWQEGALDSKYFMDRLQEIHQYLQHYEMGAVSGGWTCQWDSEHKRYFYVNERTQQSQWNFPAECSMQVALQTKQMWANHVSDVSAASSTTFQSSGAQFPLVSSSMSEERSQSNLPSTSGVFIVKHKTEDLRDQYPTPSASWVCSTLLSQPSPPPPPPGVDSPPPPPPKTPPPKSPPPPPPDSTELEEGEIPDVDMEIDDSNSFESGSCVRKVSQSSKSSSQHSSSVSPKHNLECSSTRSPDHPLRISTSMVSSTSANSSEQTQVIAKPPQPLAASSSMEPVQVSSENTFTALWAHSLPSCSSTQNGVFINSVPVNVDATSLAPPGTLPLATAESMGTREVPQLASTSDCSENSHAPVLTSAPIQAPAPKKEKRKSKLLPGLALKKKNIPSLVQKWQKIKKQQEREDKNSDEARISTSM